MKDYASFLERKRIAAPPVGFEVASINEKLFDFQRDIVRWALRRGRAAIWAGTGLGKTAMQLEWANHVAAHADGSVLVLCPLAVAEQTAGEAAKFNIDGAEVRRDGSACRITITNYEMMHKLDAADYVGVVLDECFPCDTKVDTPSGSCYIKDVSVGDKILNACGVDTVSDIHRREVFGAIKIKVRGRFITSSPSHPFFTQRGWVCACDIEPGDSIMETAKALRMVRGSGNPEGITGGQEEVLRQILLSEMANDPAGSEGQDVQSGSESPQGSIKESVACKREPESVSGNREGSQLKPNGGPGNESKGLPNIESHEPLSFRAWGKRERFDEAAAVNAGCSVRELGAGICFVSGPTKTRFSDSLQAGLGESRFKNLHRGGWSIAPSSEEKDSGREEGCDAGFARVESLEVLEQGHPELDQYRDAEGHVYFYDIGGTRHPSFSVNGLLVHNSGILKAADGATRKAITEFCQRINYRLSCSATPAPNDYMELGTQCEFLGIMSRTEMLATFFTHDGGETALWRLKKHAVDKFWEWVASWAVMITHPSDLGYEDRDFRLLPIHYHAHVVPAKQQEGYLVPCEAKTLNERRAARRDSLAERCQLAADIVNASPNEQWLIWCDLNDESELLTKLIHGAVEVAGKHTNEQKIQRMLDFTSGKARVLVSKPSIAGWGMNWQHCANMVFVGLSDSFEAMYQAVRRCWRFGQKREVNVHVVTSELEGAVVRNIKRKERDFEAMQKGMVKHMKAINTAEVHSARKEEEKYEREVKRSENWAAFLGDSCEVLEKISSESVHYSIFSPPFESLFTYSNSNRDLGNSRTRAQFYEHFEFIVGELYRVLKPGRLLSFHCMNMPTSKERTGVIGLDDFRGDLIRIHQKAGFIYHSEVVIWKDPVTAMQRTKALGLLHKQIVKDSCMSRHGIPDYLVTMRKPGTNPERVSGLFDRYIGEDGTGPGGACTNCKGTGRWTDTDGDEYVCSCQGTDKATRFSIEVWQRYASPVWMDINPSDTLQKKSAREHEDERHVCPLQLQVIERALELWTNPGDVVLSPFMGIGSEGYVSLRNGRKFIGVELKRSYWEQACRNLAAAEESQQQSLFEGTEEGEGEAA